MEIASPTASLRARDARLASEDVNIDRLAQSWNPATAGERDVDTRRDDVR
jgi:hypothetical protein